MWLLLSGLTALLALAHGECETDTLFFGDLDPTRVPPYQVQVISALGVYVREANNVSLLAYKHIGRPDQFLLQEPTESPTKRWVVATLPDDKKPAKVLHPYEAWPEAGNIIADGEFTVDPWTVPADSDPPAWRVKGCDGGRTPIQNLSVVCVPRTFGQCSSDRWVAKGTTLPSILTLSELTAHEAYSNGRREYRSLTARLAVGADGRWRLTSFTPGGTESGLGTLTNSGLVSVEPAERLEFVRKWNQFDTPGGPETPASADTTVSCAAIPSISAAAGEEATDPCAGSPCKNGGTCLPAPGEPASYVCRCRFDSVSPNCAQVKECSAPPQVNNAKLLFTSDLSPHGKAFYRCDVGYTQQRSNISFAICDGSSWKNLPSCVPITTDVTIAAAYIHHCAFDDGWCEYRHAPTLTLQGKTLGWERRDARGEGKEERKKVATAAASSGDVARGPRVARLQTPCMFVPAEGCVVIDVNISPKGDRNVTLTITDDDDVTLWRTAKSSSSNGWTTATLTLPPGGNRLTFEAVLEATGDAVSLDNIRVFQWNCGQVTKLLFPPAAAAGHAVSRDCLLPLLSLLVLLAYSRMTGVLEE